MSGPLDGPAPPGGWQAPPAHPQSAWAGRPLASWGRRAGAAALDGLIVSIPIVAVTSIVVATAIAGNGVGALVSLLVGLFAIPVAMLFYAPLLMARQGVHNGQTWGKQIVGITVLRDAGQPVDVGFALLRGFVVQGLVFFGLGSLLLSIPTLLNYLWPLWDDQNRCLHDMIVSTHVVKVGYEPR
ncbi:MAG TPA: RDD family protein [Thermoleophilaceae bacterium]